MCFYAFSLCCNMQDAFSCVHQFVQLGCVSLGLVYVDVWLMCFLCVEDGTRVFYSDSCCAVTLASGRSLEHVQKFSEEPL